MVTGNRMYEYTQGQNEISSAYMRKAQEIVEEYRQTLDSSAAEARNKTRVALEDYYAEVMAAYSGDDMAERIGAAQSNYQQKYAEIYQEYLTSCQETYQRFVDNLEILQADSGVETLNRYIELLEDAKKDLATRAKKTTSQTKKSGSSKSEKA
jgi:vacuolar-type H+-ATPase subunit E/Vma4